MSSSSLREILSRIVGACLHRVQLFQPVSPSQPGFYINPQKRLRKFSSSNILNFREKLSIYQILGHGLDVENIVDDEVETIMEMKKDCGKFENISFVNNESDPEKSWWKPESWRAEVEYPLTVARNIYNHRQKYFNGGGPR